MLKSDIIWPESFRYQTNTEWEPVGFFSEALCNATSFDLMLGFFSSSAINVLSYGFALFIYNGGKMRMIINDILSHEDVTTLTMAHNGNSLPFFDLRNLEQLSKTLNKRDRHFFDCLSWLIRNDRIEIKIVRMVNGSGIAHTKCGSFFDGKNKVGFEGSVNFSYSAFMQNKESLGVYCDWNGRADEGRIRGIQKSFDDAFNGIDRDVEFVEVVDLKGYGHSYFRPKGINELLLEELSLIENTKENKIPETVRLALKKTKSEVERAIEKIKEEETFYSTPHFPFLSGPRPYQNEAFEKWKGNGQKGFFAMATGTGKTITSLNCLLEIYNRLGYYKAIIVVPTLVLVNQWANECRKFGFNNIVNVSSLSHSWREDLANIEMTEQIGNDNSSPDYIIIVTYASLIKPNVYSKLFGFPKGKVLMIADEAHNMGSKQLSELLPKIPYPRRIGLSATPKRQFDEKGNRQISNFFGFDKDQYTLSYTMADAIRNKILCRYFYYPHVVNLNDVEYEEYLKLTKEIAKYLTSNGKEFKDSPLLTALMIKRKRIVHKAVNKVSMFRQILMNHYSEKKTLKYTLIYVPEGSGSDIDDEIAKDFDEDDLDSVHLIDLYTSIVRDIDSSITVAQYTSKSKDRSEILSAYSSGKLDVLTSMKCLDEGVDVPRSELAIFCASTGNPRQFIQRRGRILRTHKDKDFAVIHDLVVAPIVNSKSQAYTVERNLLRSELKRVKDFAELSENPTAPLMELPPIMILYNLTLYEENE